MRHKLGDYQGKEKHTFSAKMIRYGSYKDRATGEEKTSILFRDLKDEDGNILSDHVWVKEDSYIKKTTLEKGRIYSFEAKVGTYNRGRTSKDYQINKLRHITAA